MDLDNESGSPDGNTASEHGTESSNQAARGNRRPSNPIRKDPVESNGNGSKQQRTSSRSPSGSRESSVGAIEHGHHESFLGDSSGLAFSHAARLHLSSQRDEESFSPIISLATSPTLDADQPQNRHRPSITEKQKGDDIAKTTDSTARGTGDCEGKPAYPPGSYQPTFRRQQDDATSATSSSGPPRSRYSSAFTVENAGNGDEQYRRSQKEFRQSPTPTPRGSMDDFNAHFWFSENPLPPLDIATFTLPSKAKALEMSKWYFENATPTYRILHRPTIEACIESGLHAEDEDMDAQVRVRGGDIRDKIMRDKSVCAVVFMVWAIGCQYPLGKAVHDDTEAQVLREKS